MEETLKITQFQPPCDGQGHLPLYRVAQKGQRNITKAVKSSTRELRKARMEVSGAVSLYSSFLAHSIMVQLSSTAVHKMEVLSKQLLHILIDLCVWQGRVPALLSHT